MSTECRSLLQRVAETKHWRLGNPFAIGSLLLALTLMSACCLFRPGKTVETVRTVTVPVEVTRPCLDEKPKPRRTVDPSEIAEGGDGVCDESFDICLKPRGSVAVQRNLEQSEEYSWDAWELCGKKPQEPAEGETQ